MRARILTMLRTFPLLYSAARTVYNFSLDMRSAVDRWWQAMSWEAWARNARFPRMGEAADGNWSRSSASNREVVMLVVSDLRIDPRVEREARALAAAGYSVSVLCPEPYRGALGSLVIDWGPGVRVELIRFSAARFITERPGFLAEELYWEAVKRKPLAFHAHDLSTAYAAMAAAKYRGSHLVIDFHEWFSENVHWNTSQVAWVPYPAEWKSELQELERRCLTEASATITVCDSIADGMESELGGKRPHVIRNIPDVATAPSRKYAPLKEQFGLPESTFVLLWQGGTGPTRLIEPIIEALAHAPHCVFVIRGPSLDQFGADYLALAEPTGVADRVILSPPVPSKDVVAAARGADAGIWTLPALCRNFTFALPNKIFEYLAADLPVLVAHYPEAKRLVLDNSVGLTFDPYDPVSIAGAVNRLIQDRELRATFAANTQKALATLDAKTEWKKLVSLYDDLPKVRQEAGTCRA